MNVSTPPLDNGFDLTFDYCFTDKELQDILGVIELKAAGGDSEGLDGALELLGEQSAGGGTSTLPLQFQPREAPLVKHEDESQPGTAGPVGASSVSSFATPFASPPNTEQPMAQHAVDSAIMAQQQAAVQQLMAQQNGAATVPAVPNGVPTTTALPMAVAPVNVTGPNPLGMALPSPLAGAPGGPLHVTVPLMQSGTGPIAFAAHLPGGPPTAAAARFAPSVSALPAKGGMSPLASADANGKGQISHSTVEKQRRDRINSLIDELRELVPPQRPISGAQQPRGGPPLSAEALEARRPKHVVLADTIALLKQLQTKLMLTPEQTGANHGFANGQEPSNSEGASKGSSSQDDMDVAGAPQMPYIPCQMTQTSGVTVERGPDCLYVQVKCRDRKGLLSDIINSLKLLPLEIRTAAVTTTADGTVRDVFEVRLDDPALSPEDVQNMVHDALFQQHIISYDQLVNGKRQRAQFA